MSAMRWPITSCFQIGTPHCTRAAAQPRQISRQRLATPAHTAGSVSRPVFSVTSAILSPCPSRPIRFSRGTRTLRKVITPLASALSPMNRQRYSTCTPSQPVSTMNALIRWVSGSRAITTSSSARVPLVHHSFSPFST
jgi:hypothetical protein